MCACVCAALRAQYTATGDCRLPGDVHMVFELCEFDLNGLTTRPDFQLSQVREPCTPRSLTAPVLRVVLVIV